MWPQASSLTLAYNLASYCVGANFENLVIIMISHPCAAKEAHKCSCRHYPTSLRIVVNQLYSKFVLTFLVVAH